MADLYTFKEEFEPILLPGQVARIITSTETKNVECVAVGAMPSYIKDFGALAAATWDTDNEDQNLQMNDNELLHMRMRVLDDMQLRFNNLGSTRQWRTQKTDFTLRMAPSEDNANSPIQRQQLACSEFFVYEDDTPRFDFYSPVALATSRVSFHGFRYAVAATGKMATMTIWVSGWPSGQR